MTPEPPTDGAAGERPTDGAAAESPTDGAAGETPTDGAAAETQPGRATGSGPDATRSTEGRSPGEYPLPPGPAGYPVLGCAPSLLRDPFAFYDTLAGYGDVVRWKIPGYAFTTLLHPDHVEQALVEDFERLARDFAEFGADFAPEGLLMTDGEQWRRQRKVMQPAFTMERVRSYADTMAGFAERESERWADGQAVALNRAFSGLALRILSKALFDVDVDPAADDEAITHAARVINERVDVSDVSAFLPTWVPTPANLKYRRAMARYRERVDELIDERRAAGTDGDDLLSILLTAEGPEGHTLSDEEVRDNLITFTFAGHETTALGLTYALMLVAHHDEARERLHAEVDEVLGTETPTFEHVPRLSYTEKVLKEAMRLHPPAHVLFRRAEADVVVDGYRIPEGTVVTLPQFHVHTDERFYDAPDEFRPDRWTESFEETLPEYAYFPFGGGPRHCIGMRFAMLEMRLVLAVLARDYDFDLLSDPDPEIDAVGTRRPAEDVRVRVHER